MDQVTIAGGPVVTMPAALVPASSRWLWCNRSRRVTLLVMGIVVLSVADLAVTLAYLRANWMMEANPIAVWLIETTQSPWALGAFKMATVTVCALLLWCQRRHIAGEIAAWCAVGVLAIMSVMWHNYSQTFDSVEEMILVQATSFDDGRLGLP